MAWSVVSFGKYKDKGKTLPQIVFTDPDWFFWAIGAKAFEGKGENLKQEAQKINTSARAIRIPNNTANNLEAEYLIHAPTGKFGNMHIVPASQPVHQGSSPAFRKKVIDLSVPRDIAPYDKLGCKTLISSVKFAVFGSSSARLTKVRCEEFFDTPENFAT